MSFLPVNKADMDSRGWDECDFILVTGDAYVDHPSFGPAIISRILEDEGFRVGIIAQPDWRDVSGFTVLGRPVYAFLVTAGNLDSMVSHYSSFKNRRRKDDYSPGGITGKRPDRATIVYTSRLKQAYKGIPVIIGGIEASLRRLSHYDYWCNKVRHSVLLDSKADLLVYGMAERVVRSIAEKIRNGISVKDMVDIRGTVYCRSELPQDTDFIELPDFHAVCGDKQAYADAFRLQYQHADPYSAQILVQQDGTRWVIQNPPDYPLSQKEMDRVYSLPYMRTYHPSYENQGGIPAIREVEFSIVSSRGCFGGCHFCSLHFHQGKIISSRSHESIIEEAKLIIGSDHFKGYIHDVGGPTANFRNGPCKKAQTLGTCRDRECMYPVLCKNLEIDHRDYRELLGKLRNLPEIKKVFIRSGIRYDYVLGDGSASSRGFINDLCKYHVSGQLKIAPEHVSPEVLGMMGKPGIDQFNSFVSRFKEMNRKLDKKQYVIPYFISGHPGSTMKYAVELAEFLRDYGFQPDQVQDFYPTPGTLSTCIFYTGIDPLSGKNVYVPREMEEKKMQRALLQWKSPGNRQLVKKALIKAGRTDLIGLGKKCLIRR